MSLKQNLLISLLLPSLLGWFSPVDAKDEAARYKGMEFYGSSQMTRKEVEKVAGVREGASAGATESAVARLKKYFDQRHMDANVDAVVENGNDLYLVVDMSDPTVEAPARRLIDAHHVELQTEKPLLLLAQLNARKEAVAAQGRKITESMQDGLVSFSDEPCNQIVQDIRKYALAQRKELIDVANYDPAPERRVDAITILGWASSFEDTAEKLLPAIDDIAPAVRVSIDRFIFPRLDLLGSNFPYGKLADAWSRQITRRTHGDRSKGLYCLLALCTQQPQVLNRVRAASEARIRELSQTTVLPTIKTPSDKLLALFASGGATNQGRRRGKQNNEQQPENTPSFDF